MSGGVLGLHWAVGCKRCILRAFGRLTTLRLWRAICISLTRVGQFRCNRTLPWKWNGGNMHSRLNVSRIALKTVVLLSALMIGTLPGLARDNRYETIDGTAFGTGNQMGQNIGVTLLIYE